jgi:hypothetical protein
MAKVTYIAKLSISVKRGMVLCDSSDVNSVPVYSKQKKSVWAIKHFKTVHKTEHRNFQFQYHDMDGHKPISRFRFAYLLNSMLCMTFHQRKLLHHFAMWRFDARRESVWEHNIDVNSGIEFGPTKKYPRKPYPKCPRRKKDDDTQIDTQVDNTIPW